MVGLGIVSSNYNQHNIAIVTISNYVNEYCYAAAKTMLIVRRIKKNNVLNIIDGVGMQLIIQ